MQNNMWKKGLVIGILIVLFISAYPSTSSTQKTTPRKNDINVYYTYDQLTELLVYLKSAYPKIFNYSSLGKTYEGRNLWLVKISDNVTTEEEEPAVLYTGGIHGNEDPGYQVVIYSLKAIVENYTHPYVNESFTNRIRSIVNTTELYFIPMWNPDGIEAGVRKNRRPNNCLFGETRFRGVDIGFNFDYNWDDPYQHPFRYIAVPHSWDDLIYIMSQKFGNLHLFERTCVLYPVLDCHSVFGYGVYRGPDPFSENETQAVKRFFENHSINISVDYHIYGEFIFYPKPWNYTYPSDKTTFGSIAENISKINGYKLPSGKGLKWLNYSGGFGDWSYTTHHVFSFGIELCEFMSQGWCPDKVYILKLCETHLLVNLYLAERAYTLDSSSIRTKI